MGLKHFSRDTFSSLWLFNTGKILRHLSHVRLQLNKLVKIRPRFIEEPQISKLNSLVGASDATLVSPPASLFPVIVGATSSNGTRAGHVIDGWQESYGF